MDDLQMSLNERIRLDAMNRVKRGEMTVVAAAELMAVSLRQGRRIWKRFKTLSAGGLVHRGRGRPGNRRMADERRQEIVKAHQEKYADFGPTLACEKLAGEGMAISPNTLTAFLKERGLWERRRRRGRHRKRRERRASLGSMIQMDGSHHDWFEGRAVKCVLMVLIDDATNQTYARFYPAETTEAALDVFGRWAKRRGLPRSVYADRHSIYRDEDHPDKPTQFGRAMKQLGVELIQARSPQAKGRVERRNAVFQDRLVKEMRLRNISDMTQANGLLEGIFLDELNHRFSVEPANGVDLHRAVESGTALEEVLCVHEPRTVGQDWCVRWRNRWLQIAAGHESLRLPRKKVTIKELAAGRLLLDYNGQRLSFTEGYSRPEKKRKPIINNRRWKPDGNHPWKQGEPVVGPRPAAIPAPAAPARGLPPGKRKTG